MDCPVCGAAVTTDSGRFCTRCGAALAQRCPACGRDGPPGAAFCAHCGAGLGGEGDPGPPPREPEAARSEVERRQLTVMFCDLVGSTALSAPARSRGPARRHRRLPGCCAAVIARYDGFVAKYMGDGVLAYFGYPRAHEDDAERAVRAGLADRRGGRPRSSAASGVELAGARIGIATGLVVVGDLIGEGAARSGASSARRRTSPRGCRRSPSPARGRRSPRAPAG